jgi:anti-sigma factor RsiW
MHWTERLSDYVDGELAPADRAACDAHLAECAECRGALDEMQLVMSLAKADPDVMPVNNLWPGILARIAPAEAAAFTARDNVIPMRAPASAGARRISFTLPQLALAASLLIAVSAGVAYIAAGRAAVTATIAATPIQAVADSFAAPVADVAPASFADAQFDRAVSDLEQVLVEQRDRLDPQTVMVIERNLAAIDKAIQEARAALDADPANPFLNSYLAESRKRKLDLLRTATTLNSAGD